MSSSTEFNDSTSIGEILSHLRTLDDIKRQEFYQYLVKELERASMDKPRAFKVCMVITEQHEQAANEGDDETGDPEQTEDDDDPDVIDVPEGEGDFRGYGEEEDDKEMEDEDEEDEEPAPQAPSRPRRRYRGSQKHFSVLLTRGVIVPGNSLTVPALNNPGLVATMVYVSHKDRVSTWNVTCPALNLNGQITGTGPTGWRLALLGLRFPAPKLGTWARGVRVIANGQDIGGITDLKIQYL